MQAYNNISFHESRRVQETASDLSTDHIYISSCKQEGGLSSRWESGYFDQAMWYCTCKSYEQGG